MAQPPAAAPSVPQASASSVVGQLTAEQKAEVIREAYRKHAAELLAIEDAQQKLTLLFLGIIGAGTSFLGGKDIVLSEPAKWSLSWIAFVIVALAATFTYFRNRARRGTRTLLVNCEVALGFYDQGAYIQGGHLNPPIYAQFPLRGDWLGYMSWFAVLTTAAAFVTVLWVR